MKVFFALFIISNLWAAPAQYQAYKTAEEDKQDTLMYKVASTGIQCFIDPCPYYELMDCNGNPLDTVAGIIDTQGNIIDAQDLIKNNKIGYGFIHEDSLTGWYHKGDVLEVVEIRNDCNVSIGKKPEMASAVYVLGAPSPNPFNPSTRIPYNLGSGKQGTLKIFDIAGKQIKSYKVKGIGTIIWRADRLPIGVYIIQVKAANKIHSRKIILQK
jgi:hypothetical protein